MSPVLMALTTADERLLLAMLARRRSGLDSVMRWVTRLGSWYVVVPTTVALAFGPLAAARPAGVVALSALVASHLCVQLLKRTVCRERPALPVGLGFLIEPEDRFSFPSGHAAAGMSVGLALLVLTGPVVGVPAMLIGLLVGLSRCYLGVHYPGDVVMGWLLAVPCVAAAVLLL